MQTNDINNTTTKPTQITENNINQPSVQKIKAIPSLNASSSSSSTPATVTTTVLVLEPKFQNQVYLKTNKTTNLDDYINSKKNAVDVNKTSNIECIEADKKMEDMIVDSSTTHSLPAKLSPNTSPIRKQSKLQRPLVTAIAKPVAQSSDNSSNKTPLAARTSAIPAFSRNSFQNKLVKSSITSSSTNPTNSLMTTSAPLMNLSNNSVQSKLLLSTIF